MRQIVIKIPEKSDIKQWWEKLLFKFRGGFKCGCGIKQDFRGIQFESSVKGKRLIFSSTNIKHKAVCPECVRDEINMYPYLIFTITHKCDWCNHVKKTTTFPRNKELTNHIHFGDRWWNGHHICQDCLNEGISNRGDLTCSRFEIIDNAKYAINELGIRVKIK